MESGELSILIGQKMQLTGWDGNVARNVTCVDSNTFIEWPYTVYFPYCGTV